MTTAATQRQFQAAGNLWEETEKSENSDPIVGKLIARQGGADYTPRRFAVKPLGNFNNQINQGASRCRRVRSMAEGHPKAS
ncbi:MAG TPA: hypothetical protein VGB07_08495 [Blastocatellia bacterium]